MEYDLIIIGAGPAGLTASIYASRYKIKHLVIGSQLGGAMSWASSIENYPGFKKITGMELTKKMVEQTKALGGEIKIGQIKEIRAIGDFRVVGEDREKYLAKTLIIATGMQRQKLGVSGEEKYLGKGVSYCATCDAALFRDKTAAVIGGSNAAVTSAIHLTEFASKVYIVYRKKPLRADPIWIDKAQKNSKIELIYETNVTQILGDEKRVTGVKIDQPYQGKSQLILDGVFIEIGGVPGTELVKPLGVELDENGYVKVKPDMSTSITGIFAAGDIANVAGELQQIVTACSEGAIAATSVYRWLTKVK